MMSTRKVSFILLSTIPYVKISYKEDMHTTRVVAAKEVLQVDEKMTSNSSVDKGCVQCYDATSRSGNLCCKHHEPKKNELLARKVRDKKKCRVEDNYAGKHIYGFFTHLCKSFVDPFETNMNKEITLRFLHEPVFSLVHHFQKQYVQRAKTKCYEHIIPLVAKLKLNGNFNMNEGVKYKGQNSLKRKIERVTGDIKRENIRVAMDSIFHKIPQGQGISDELKREILKKLTDPITITREVQYKSSIRRIMSLQESLESYTQFEKLKLGKEKMYSPLTMLIPFQRILSLPDLQSFSYVSQIGDLAIDDFGHSSLKKCDTFNDQDIEANKEYNVSITASTSDSKSKSEQADRPDNLVEKQENVQKIEIETKNLNHEIPHIHVDTKNKDEYKYVKYVLEISGLTSNANISSWYSRDTPIDPSLYEEMENDPEFCPKKDGKCNHHVLFDLINETMLEIYERSHSYHPIGCHIVHKVWTHMNKYLCLRSKDGQNIDNYVSSDLSKNDGWCNHQFYDEFFCLKVEDMIFHDLLEEIVLDLACL